MSQKNDNRFSSWLLTRPVMFALTAFVLMTLASVLAGLIGGASVTGIGYTLVAIAFLGAAGWLVRKLPAGNLNRHQFVAINNAQTVITSVAFIVSTLIIVHNAQQLMLRLLWMESHSSASFMIALMLLTLFYLYLCGVFIGNLYAKYRRVRTMGVGVWKTLATAPFGFCMLWIPGYLMDDAKKDAAPTDGWYNRLTQWTMARPMRSAAVLVLLVVMSGFTFGFPAIILTLALGALFAAWSAIAGTDTLRKNLGGAYATTAIIINIAAIIGTVCYFSLAAPRAPVPAPQATITTQTAR